MTAVKSYFMPILLMFAMFISACTEESMQAVSGNSAGKTAAEKQLETEARSLNKVTKDIIVRNTVEGALVGAAAGCGIALILGGSRSDCLRGAAMGGVAGGVAGNNIGRQAAAKKVELIKADRVLANLSGVSKRLNGVEARLRNVVASQNAELRSLKRQLNAKQVSKSAYQARVNAINSNRRVVSNELLKSEKNVAKTRNEIASARNKGQKGLVSVSKAAASNQARLERVRRSIKLVK